VEKRLDSDCHSCWLLACYECWRSHGHRTCSRRRCGRASCEERHGQVRPMKSIDGPCSVYDKPTLWWPDAEKERIFALPYYSDSTPVP
jgi:hypothetical protein